MAKTEKTKKPPHSWPATANTKTAKSSRENVGIKVEFGFYHKRKKKKQQNSWGNLKGTFHSEQTPGYKITSVLTPFLSPSPQRADVGVTVEANKQFCKRLQI